MWRLPLETEVDLRLSSSSVFKKCWLVLGLLRHLMLVAGVLEDVICRWLKARLERQSW